MKSIKSKSQNMSGRERRHRRIRAKVSGTAERPRLSVFRSNKHIYAQVIDDSMGKTLVSVSDAEMKSGKRKGKLETSKVVGGEIAKRALEKKISKVVFDRSGYLYAGRVKQIAEGARAAGLDF